MLIGRSRKSGRNRSCRLAACLVLWLLTLPCLSQQVAPPSRIGMPFDWTHRHVGFSSAAAQASSIYFTSLSNTTCGDTFPGGGCAVKLTRSGLN